MNSRRPWIGALGLACLVLALSLASPASAAGTAPAPTSGLVAASGTTLTVNGKPWKFVGYNMPCAQPFLLAPADLAYVLAEVADNSGANAIRVWFFQKNGGPGNWGPFDRLVATAKADGIRLIPTLVNEWPTCEANPPVTIQKTLAWYQGGYKQNDDGYPLSFRTFAVAVAQHFANNPTIAFWQLVNEATAPTLLANGKTTCDESAAAHAIRSFADDMTDAIHAVDPNHLVSLGTLTGGQCGTSGADYQYIHAGAVDLCEYHDYDYSYQPIATDTTPGGLAATLHACQALGKPFFVGESGVVPNVQPSPATQPLNCGPWPLCTPTPVTYATLARRAAIFKEKITDAFASGVSGYLIWFKGANYSAANDSYAIGDGDPTEAMMAGLSLGPTTAATIPPVVNVASPPGHHHGSWTDSPVLLVIGGAVLILVWIGMWRSRRGGPQGGADRSRSRSRRTAP